VFTSDSHCLSIHLSAALFMHPPLSPHFLCPSLVTFTFVSLATFNVTLFFCCQSVSEERDTALMNCEFFGTEEDQVMVTFIHLHFLIQTWNLFCRWFFWPRDSIRVLEAGEASWQYLTPWIDNLTEENSSMLNNSSNMTFVVPITSRI
jgi:hypothetical protein